LLNGLPPPGGRDLKSRGLPAPGSVVVDRCCGGLPSRFHAGLPSLRGARAFHAGFALPADGLAPDRSPRSAKGFPNGFFLAGGRGLKSRGLSASLRLGTCPGAEAALARFQLGLASPPVGRLFHAGLPAPVPGFAPFHSGRFGRFDCGRSPAAAAGRKVRGALGGRRPSLAAGRLAGPLGFLAGFATVSLLGGSSKVLYAGWRGALTRSPPAGGRRVAGRADAPRAPYAAGADGRGGRRSNAVRPGRWGISATSGSGTTISSNSGSEPSTYSMVWPSMGISMSCRVAVKPRMTSRTLVREVSGERKVSTSSLVAATADCRYSDVSTDNAVTCDMPPPE
jgi:hypothetical protein